MERLLGEDIARQKILSHISRSAQKISSNHQTIFKHLPYQEDVIALTCNTSRAHNSLVAVNRPDRLHPNARTLYTIAPLEGMERSMKNGLPPVLPLTTLEKHRLPTHRGYFQTVFNALVLAACGTRWGSDAAVWTSINVIDLQQLGYDEQATQDQQKNLARLFFKESSDTTTADPCYGGLLDRPLLLTPGFQYLLSQQTDRLLTIDAGFTQPSDKPSSPDNYLQWVDKVLEEIQKFGNRFYVLSMIKEFLKEPGKTGRGQQYARLLDGLLHRNLRMSYERNSWQNNHPVVIAINPESAFAMAPYPAPVIGKNPEMFAPLPFVQKEWISQIYCLSKEEHEMAEKLFPGKVQPLDKIPEGDRLSTRNPNKQLPDCSVRYQVSFPVLFANLIDHILNKDVSLLPPYDTPLPEREAPDTLERIKSYPTNQDVHPATALMYQTLLRMTEKSRSHHVNRYSELHLKKMLEYYCLHQATQELW
jgi:hypothetical protein